MPMLTPQKVNFVDESNHGFVMPVEYSNFAAKFDGLGEAHYTGSPCEGTARPANDSLVAHLNQGAVMITVRSQKPSLELSNSHLKLSKDLPILSNDELSSDGMSCHILKPRDGQVEKTGLDTFEVHLSDTCQRRFVMFDHSGRRNQVICHPSMVSEFSGLLEFPSKITNIEQINPEKHLKEDYVFGAFSSAFAEGYNEDKVTICVSKENSEDLDALLWSDDELSSEGHSPSDLTWSDAKAMTANVGTGVNVGKKRKACAETETDSTATSMDSTLKQVLQTEIPDFSGDSGYSKEVFAASDLSLPDEESSNGSTNSLVYKCPNKKTRKDKIHTTLQLLRSIIPGAVSMDAACLLGEAVRYVKNLQVEVEKLEGRRFR